MGTAERVRHIPQKAKEVATLPVIASALLGAGTGLVLTGRLPGAVLGAVTGAVSGHLNSGRGVQNGQGSE